ncbi:MAG: hypothetical protein ACRCVA_14770, partial [Phreatobacter sp.]
DCAVTRIACSAAACPRDPSLRNLKIIKFCNALIAAGPGRGKAVLFVVLCIATVARDGVAEKTHC